MAQPLVVAEEPHSLALLAQQAGLLHSQPGLAAPCAAGKTNAGNRPRGAEQDGLPNSEVILGVLRSWGSGTSPVPASRSRKASRTVPGSRRNVVARALAFDGSGGSYSERLRVRPIQDQRPGASRHRPALGYVRVGQAHEVGEAAAELRAELVLKPVLQRVHCRLRLHDRALDGVTASFVRLVPPPVFDADLSAFDFDGSHPNAGPEDEECRSRALHVHPGPGRSGQGRRRPAVGPSMLPKWHARQRGRRQSPVPPECTSFCPQPNEPDFRFPFPHDSREGDACRYNTKPNAYITSADS